jgi:hypothetical protein
MYTPLTNILIILKNKYNIYTPLITEFIKQNTSLRFDQWTKETYKAIHPDTIIQEPWIIDNTFMSFNDIYE